jgi:hypothetical protein
MAPRELSVWAHVVDFAIVRNVPLVPVVLELALDENIVDFGASSVWEIN